MPNPSTKRKFDDEIAGFKTAAAAEKTLWLFGEALAEFALKNADRGEANGFIIFEQGSIPIINPFDFLHKIYQVTNIPGINFVRMFRELTSLHNGNNPSRILTFRNLHIYMVIALYASCRIFEKRTPEALKDLAAFFSAGNLEDYFARYSLQLALACIVQAENDMILAQTDMAVSNEVLAKINVEHYQQHRNFWEGILRSGGLSKSCGYNTLQSITSALDKLCRDNAASRSLIEVSSAAKRHPNIMALAASLRMIFALNILPPESFLLMFIYIKRLNAVTASSSAKISYANIQQYCATAFSLAQKFLDDVPFPASEIFGVFNVLPQGDYAKAEFVLMAKLGFKLDVPYKQLAQVADNLLSPPLPLRPISLGR